MKFTDILELAKQGYTPADIKELLSLSINETEQTLHNNQGDINQEEVTESELATPEDKPTENEVEADTNTVDYKKLYEETQLKLNKIQQQNTNMNIQTDNKSSDADVLADIVRGFM